MASMSTDGTAWICSEPMINLISVLFDLRLQVPWLEIYQDLQSFWFQETI